MMEYPHILLPKEVYKLQIGLTEADVKDLILVRRSLCTKEETTNEAGSVRSAAFIPPEQEHHFFNLSCNLLGIFLADHLVFILTNDHARKYWLDKSSIPKVKDIQYEVKEDSFPIFLPLKAVFNEPMNFSREKPGGKIETFQGKCWIVHKPLEGNYWHFEIEVHDEKGQKINAKSSAWKAKAAALFFESHLKVHLSCVGVSVDIGETLYTES